MHLANLGQGGPVKVTRKINLAKLTEAVGSVVCEPALCAFDGLPPGGDLAAKEHSVCGQKSEFKNLRSSSDTKGSATVQHVIAFLKERPSLPFVACHRVNRLCCYKKPSAHATMTTTMTITRTITRMPTTNNSNSQ